MGMFDYVNHEAKCPECGAIVDGFQSKDGPCELITLEISDVDNFYTDCAKCNAWLEYERVKMPTFQLYVGLGDLGNRKLVDEGAITE